MLGVLYQWVRNRRIEANMGLLHAQAKRLRKKYPGLDGDAVFSECQAAFVRAATTFNPKLGWQFSTYAYHAMSRAVYRIAQPRKHVTYQLDDAKGDFILPSVEGEIHTGIEEELRAYVDKLESVIDRRVIRLRFGLDGDPPCTLVEVGERCGFTKERARQIQNRALAALRVAVQAAL